MMNEIKILTPMGDEQTYFVETLSADTTDFNVTDFNVTDLKIGPEYINPDHDPNKTTINKEGISKTFTRTNKQHGEPMWVKDFKHTCYKHDNRGHQSYNKNFMTYFFPDRPITSYLDNTKIKELFVQCSTEPAKLANYVYDINDEHTYSFYNATKILTLEIIADTRDTIYAARLISFDTIIAEFKNNIYYINYTFMSNTAIKHKYNLDKMIAATGHICYLFRNDTNTRSWEYIKMQDIILNKTYMYDPKRDLYYIVINDEFIEIISYNIELDKNADPIDTNKLRKELKQNFNTVLADAE